MGAYKKKKRTFSVSLMNRILPFMLKIVASSFKEDFQPFPFMLILVGTISISHISLSLKSICSQSKKCKFFLAYPETGRVKQSPSGVTAVVV